MDGLAGKQGTFGAIGAADRGKRIFQFFAHCSGGDYLDEPDYPRTLDTAQKALFACRNYILGNMQLAIKEAGKLVNKQDQLNRGQISINIPCGFADNLENRAKCLVLKYFGLALHATQDFYAHTNWVDIPDLSKPVGRNNPPGLGKRGPSPFLNLRVSNPVFPEGLLSGCGDLDGSNDREGGCFSETGKLRLGHSIFNKDTGRIEPTIGKGTTPRGAINDNFRHAVEAAILDTTSKWLTLHDSLIDTYGNTKGRLIICAITNDEPLKTCK